ncbi:hypothetical protein LTR12_015748 [Friedmanniomyces endolithicus]|nr:hypothetical protein LTR74_013609 [Friedmanniomyces endolithicus]KAK1809895.1 hypothetical protein LTR12_015748 [Friedmanniomyces endolithicus]
MTTKAGVSSFRPALILTAATDSQSCIHSSVSLAVLAASAIAHEIPAPEWDKYAGERAGDIAHDALLNEHADLHARGAVGHSESDAMRAWEQDHNGQPMKYEAFGEGPEVHGHYFDAREVPEHSEAGDYPLLGRDESLLSAPKPHAAFQGLTQDHTAALPAHSIPDFGDVEVDTSLEGYDHVLARSMMGAKEDDADALRIPMEVRNEYVRWTGILPTTEMHFPPSPTRRPSTPTSETHRSQHSVRDVLGMWWEDLKGGVRHVWE